MSDRSLPVQTTPINVGSGVRMRLVPQPGKGSLQVDLGTMPDTPVTRCIAHRLQQLLRGVRIREPLGLAVIVPNGVCPPELRAAPTLHKDVVRRIIHRHIGEVRECYQAALDVWPDIRGRILVRFAVAASSGRVVDTRVVDDEIGQPALACCIARSVHGWQFPSNGPTGFAVVTYPFVLEQVVVEEEP